jgi:hypothetical protein
MKAQCSGKIINAHTISKSANLKKLAVNGHVYGFRVSMQSIEQNNGRLVPELIGVNRASTFTGFCAHHDKQIFEEIEDQTISFTASQCFKLAYRTVGREAYLKVGQQGLEPVLRSSDHGASLPVQRAIQDFASAFMTGVNIGSNDSTYHKGLFDGVLLSEDYSSVRRCVLEFAKMPSVMCSGAIFPEFDFQGKTVQTLGPNNPVLAAISFNVVATDNGGAVVFTWLDTPENSVCAGFVDSLLALPPKEITDALIRFFFEHCENTFMAPPWWEALPQQTKDALINRMTLGGTPFQPRLAQCLMNDGFTYDDWVFTSAIR